jgi:hypothetical protein
MGTQTGEVQIYYLDEPVAPNANRSLEKPRFREK